jgi:hypothetical protein
MMSVDGLDQLASGDAILLGAVGAPDIPDDITLWGLLMVGLVNGAHGCRVRGLRP